MHVHAVCLVKRREELQEVSHQHPAARVPSVGPTHDHGVIHLLNDRDEVVTLQLREGERKTVLAGGEGQEERRKEGESMKKTTETRKREGIQGKTADLCLFHRSASNLK